MPDQTLFKRLKRLFSTNVVIRNVGGKLKVTDTERIQSFSDLSTNFPRGTGMYSLYSTMNRIGYNASLNWTANRLVIFNDYELMEMDPIIASALDIYADESTVKNEFGDVLTIKTDNTKIRDILHNLFYDVLNIEFNIWPWIRNMCKYGDAFLKLEISEKYGIVNVIPLSSYELTREDGYDKEHPTLVRFKQISGQSENQYLENYEIAHFRLLSDTNWLPYGKSMIESGRRIWKQLTLMEDAMLIHRIMRAPEKRVFKIDVGAVPPNEVETFMGSIINKIKKAPFVDPRTGEYNLKFNMMNMTEDFYVPVRGGDSGTSIDTLNGLQFNAIEDIEYLRNKMMAALKIPKSFLGYEEGLAGKATLAAEDVRFARTIERLQRIFLSELTKIAIVHLYVQGVKDEELTDFALQLTNPSTILEQEKISLWQEKTNLIRDIKETKMVSSDWIYKNILNFTEDQISEQKKETVDDAKLTFRLTQIEGEGNDPFKTNQTFGTPHDLALLQQQAGEPGKMPQKNLNFGDTNFMHQYSEDPATRDLADPRTGTSNVPERPLKSQYGQDSHTRGRDVLGSHEYSVSHTHQESVDSKAEVKKTIVDSLISRLGLTKIKTKEVITESLKTDEAVKRENEEGNGKDNFMDEKNILDI